MGTLPAAMPPGGYAWSQNDDADGDADANGETAALITATTPLAPSASDKVEFLYRQLDWLLDWLVWSSMSVSF